MQPFAFADTAPDFSLEGLAQNFIHLRVHSAYSLAEGALPIKELVKKTLALGMPAVAISDSDNLFGALEFSLAATEAGLQPIIACTLTLAPLAGTVLESALKDSADDAPPMGTKAPVAARLTPGQRPARLLLLVQDAAGYRNLMALVSQAHLASAMDGTPAIGLELLCAHHQGLICLSGGPEGPVGQALANGQSAQARGLVAKLMEIFPGRLYIELQRHYAPTTPPAPADKQVEEQFLALADEFSLPLVATNDCHFADPSFYEAHDALLCIAAGTVLADTERRSLTPEHYFKSGQDMAALFADIPEALINSRVIAERCAYWPQKVKPILPAFKQKGEESEALILTQMARDGLEVRLKTHIWPGIEEEETRQELARPYYERLDFEISTIIKMGFPGYFLIVADFIQWAKQHSIPVGPGRGSGAGSLVAWALTITDLDPLRFGLLFERFLNPDRISMPDFDIDFCQDRREEVIEYVQRRYGEDRVAQIITFGKMQARAVLRDVGRVLQMPYGQVDKICKLIPNNPANPVTLKAAIEAEPLLQEMMASDDTVGRLVHIALQLEGLYRHASTHAAGLVIADRPLTELVPLYRDPRSTMPVTQFSMKYVELAGLVKFDFLGLKTLTVLKNASALIAEGGEEVILEQIPFDDHKTYQLLARGDAMGVFQLESSGMRDVLRRLRPDRLEDIIALVALYRPGPMDNIPLYIAVKEGKEAPDYLHPKLAPILSETFGVMIYQEQVMQTAQILSNYSLGAADLLRRAMGKKDAAEMARQRATFIDGAVANGVDAPQASLIFEKVDKFAGYGFNKSHAAAYAVISYQTAYLKANYPVEFFAATMTYEMHNTEKLASLRQELVRQSITLLPPDINSSLPRFSVERQADGSKAVRYALAAIKGVGEAAMQSLVSQRLEGGEFCSLIDFALRCDGQSLNKRVLEKLIFAGAMDKVEPNRARAFANIEILIRYAQGVWRERLCEQNSLFGQAQEPPLPPPLPNCADWPAMERLQHEFEALGFYLSAHPLDHSRAAMQRLGIIHYQDLQQILQRQSSQRAKLAAIVVTRQEKRSARTGNKFAFLTLSDPTGIFEVMVFSEILSRRRHLLEAGGQIILEVEAMRQSEEDIRLNAQEIEQLDAVLAAGSGGGVRLLIQSPACLLALQNWLKEQPSGRTQILLEVEVDPITKERVEISLGQHYQLSATARSRLKSIPAIAQVVEF
jgi:DNA polymerase III subunit alpha